MQEWDERGCHEAEKTWSHYHQRIRPGGKMSEQMTKDQAYFARKAFMAGYSYEFCRRFYAVEHLTSFYGKGFFILGLTNAVTIGLLIVLWVANRCPVI
jgi:hypothetical protein